VIVAYDKSRVKNNDFLIVMILCINTINEC